MLAPVLGRVIPVFAITGSTVFFVYQRRKASSTLSEPPSTPLGSEGAGVEDRELQHKVGGQRVYVISLLVGNDGTLETLNC